MATIIDKFVIALGLDTKEYKRGVKDADEEFRKFSKEQDRHQGKISQGNKNMSESFVAVSKSLLKIGVAYLAAKQAFNFFADQSKSQASLGRKSYFFGMSAKGLDAWGHAVGVVGGKLEDVQGTFQNILSAAQDISVGNASPLAGLFTKLNIDLVDAQGNMRSLTDIMLDFSKALKSDEFGLSPQQKLRAAQIAGIDENTLNVLLKGPDEVRALLKQYESLSGVTEKSVSESQKMVESMAKMSAALDGLSNVIFRNLLPFVNKLSSFLDRFINKVDYSETPTRKEARGTIRKAQPDGSLPRGIRNNNPGNIKAGDWANAHGATGSDGTFAIFPSMNAGMSAMGALLQSYKTRGIDTISGIISKYAPRSENDTSAYIAQIVKQTGIGAGEHLTNEQLSRVQRAMSIHEQGRAYEGLMYGSAGASIQTNIGTINVQTQATDANGIAKDIRGAMNDTALIAGGARGMN